MLDNILTNKIDKTPAESKPLFDNNVNYEDILRERDNAVTDWKNLSEEEKSTHKNDIKNYFKQKHIKDPNSPSLNPYKNFYLLKNEIKEQINKTDSLKPISINDLHHSQSLLELLENIENTDHIRELYKLRKLTTGSKKSSGINTKESSRLKNCLRQGRDLYLAGKNGSLMVKPLNFFYSMTAYAYAIIILNNPIRYSIDSIPSSHGVNYIPDNMSTQFGGDMPHGTFSDLFCAFPTLHTKYRDFPLSQDNSASILSFFKTRYTVTIGTFLSMIPEIREYYKLITGSPGRTHPLSITIGKKIPRNTIWEFQIGDGTTRPPESSIRESFPSFEIEERHGKYIAEVSPENSHNIRAQIFVDARGELWYIENPTFPVVLPEICIHFMLTNALSNLMRYSPDHWGAVLLNEVNSDVSLIVRKYLSAFENKLPILCLRSTSKFYPYVTEA